MRCKQCGAEMEEDDDEDFDDLTEGQQADFMAGFRRSWSCPKCGFYFENN
jgi:rubrerythrin